MPLSIHFLEPEAVRSAKITFLSATNSSRAVILLPDNAVRTVTAPKNITFYTIYRVDTAKGELGIRRIDVGLEQSQPPAVVRIDYEYIPVREE